VASVTALAILVSLVVQNLLLALIAQIGDEIAGGGKPSDVPFVLATTVLTSLPLVVGFFLSLWIIAPIAAELHVAHVMMRSVLAAGVGASLSFIIGAAVAAVSNFAMDGTLFGTAIPTPSYDGAGFVTDLGFLLEQSLSAFVSVTPIAVLAGVLLWIWLDRHPVRHAVSGIVDEV
jgi:hypothetical protein